MSESAAKKSYLPSLLLAVAMAPSLAAESVEVVVHPDSKIASVTKAELSKIFHKKLRFWMDGSRAVPVDQLPSSSVREEFSREILERDVVTIELYWKRMIFSGRGVPPPEKPNDEAVLEFVRSKPGAVGYVARSATLGGVKRLEVVE